MQALLNNRVLSSFYTLIVLLSISWFLPVFDTLLVQTSLQAQVELAAYVGFIVSLQLLACHYISTFYRGWGKAHIVSFCVAVILLMNLLGLMLSFTDAFLVQGKLAKALQVVGLAALLFFLCRTLVKKPAVVSVISILYIGMISVQVIGFLGTKEPGRQGSAPGNFEQVVYQSKPNVYLLSFDAMVSPGVAAEYLDLPEPDFVSELEQSGARIFKNTFSDGDSTQPSLNTTLYLDPTIWRQNLDRSNLAFSGVAPSPVFEIFRNNGYKISTYYAGIYRLHGPYVDEYITREAAQSYCTFALPWFYFQHLGYCQFRENVIVRVFPNIGERAQVFDRQIIDNFVGRANDGQPWLNYIYTYAPGHTDSDYSNSQNQLERYQARYKASQLQTTDYMRSMLYAIRTNDPTGIIYVFGDHGAWLSRGVGLSADTAEFVIRDRHSVFSAVYPGDVCESYLGHREGEAFVTPSLIIRQLITCLSGGNDPVDREIDYSGPYDNYGFEQFVYE